MKNTPNPKQCRSSLFAEATFQGTLDYFVSPSLLGAVEHTTSTVRYGAFLTEHSAAMDRDGSRRSVSAVERIEDLQSKLGSTGVKNGVCCLCDYIELVPVEVEVQVGRGLADLDEPQPDLPAGPLAPTTANTDSVQETVELTSVT